MNKPALRPRALVLVPHHGKRRPMLVLYVEKNRFLAISGTGTRRDIPGATVEPETRAGLSRQLYKPTHFYFSRWHIVDIRMAESVAGDARSICGWLSMPALSRIS